MYTGRKHFQYNHLGSLQNRASGELAAWQLSLSPPFSFINRSSVSNCTKHWFHWPVCRHYRGLCSCAVPTYAEQPLIFLLTSLFYRTGHRQCMLLWPLCKIYIITSLLNITCSHPCFFSSSPSHWVFAGCKYPNLIISGFPVQVLYKNIIAVKNFPGTTLISVLWAPHRMLITGRQVMHVL